MKNLLFLFISAATGYAATFPTEYQAALQLYVSNKIPEASVAFNALIASAPNAQTKDLALMQASYCEAQLKHPEQATTLAAGIKDKHLGTLCRMRILVLQSKYAEILALVKNEDFSLWPDALTFDALMVRGDASGRARDMVSAEKDFRAALGYTLNDYKKATAHLRLAWLFEGPQALDDLEEVMKLKEPGPTMRYQAIASRARILAMNGKGALAIGEFERIKELTKQPHWTMVQMALAATHETLGEPDKAKACYEAVVASKNPPADLLATAKAKLGTKP
jgi:tetratricopeptide (TPR) repeat protein